MASLQPALPSLGSRPARRHAAPFDDFEPASPAQRRQR